MTAERNGGMNSGFSFHVAKNKYLKMQRLLSLLHCTLSISSPCTGLHFYPCSANSRHQAKIYKQK